MKIAIASGKGGAGKTTLAANLARVWPRDIIAIDNDVEAPNLHLFVIPAITDTHSVSLEVPRLNAKLCQSCPTPGACSDICHYKAIVRLAGTIHTFSDMCHGCGGCLAVCPTGALTPGERALGELISGTCLDGRARFVMGKTRIGEAMTPALLREEMLLLEHLLHERPSDVLMDAPPGVSCPAMTVAREADAMLLVAEPTPFGIHDFKLAHEAFAQLHIPIAVVMNRTGLAEAVHIEKEISRFCSEHGMTLLESLPFEQEAAEHYAKSELLSELSERWRNRFTTIAQKLLETFDQKDGAHA